MHIIRRTMVVCLKENLEAKGFVSEGIFPVVRGNTKNPSIPSAMVVCQSCFLFLQSPSNIIANCLIDITLVS